MKKHILIVLVGTLLLSGCSLYKKYESNVTAPDDLMGDVVNPQDTVSIGSLDWQSLFTDPLLQQLINTALANNTDMQTAQLTIEETQNEVKAAKWGYAPTFAFVPQATYTFQGGVNSFNIAVWTNEEPDSEGKVATSLCRRL